LASPIDLVVLETVLGFWLVVVLAILLKRYGVLAEEQSTLFSKLLTQIVLPAMIFVQLATHTIAPRQLLMVVVMFVSVLITLAVAWAAGRALRLPRPTIGALMIVSTFGSSTLLGYPLIQYAFPGNPEAMTDAVLASELGMGLPIFTICPMIALYFGSASQDKSGMKKAATQYFRSPIFIAVVLGLVASPFSLDPRNPLVAPFSIALDMISGAIPFLATLVLGLQLRRVSPRKILPLVLVSAVIQMGLEPYLAYLQAELYRLSAEQQEVLVLLSSMPSGVLGPVFATRFRCDGETASAIAFVNILLSVIAVPLVFSVLIT
jgi:predicted permease